MTNEQFYEFCQAIERTANGKSLSCHQDTGNRNFNIAVQLGNWADQDGTGICFDSSSHCPTELRDRRILDQIECWNVLTKEQKRHLHPFVQTSWLNCGQLATALAPTRQMQEYMDNGASLGWLIDRKNRKVYIYRHSQAFEILDNPEMVCAIQS